MAQLLIPADLLQQDRSTSKLSEVAKRIAIPSDIVGTDWPEISGICRDELGIEFDAWQDGLGQLALAKNSAGILAHTVGGFHLSAMRQLGKTYWGSGTLFGMCKKYPGLLCIWTSHHGKALDCSTEILTANRGWVTMAEILVGDQVFHPSGEITKVVGVSKIMIGNPCFEVTANDGRSLIADAEHLWQVTDMFRNHSSGSGADRKRWPKPPRVMTTSEILSAGLSKQYRATKNGKEYMTGSYRFRLPRQHGLNGLAHRDLTVDPYLLGAWLGDGTSAAGTLTCAGEDLAHWSKAIGEAGYLAVAHKYPNRAWRISILPTQGNLGSFKRNFVGKLRDLNLLNNKHVPDEYLLAAADQRLALLQGLMDTDGTVNTDGTAYFTSTLHQLSSAVLFLARSLGWRATINEKKSKFNGKEYKNQWEVTFTPKLSDGIVPFRMARKTIRIGETDKRNGRFTTSIKSIEPVSSRPVRCIKVEADDGMFLAGRGLIPTHNTTEETFEALQAFCLRSRIAPHIRNVYTGSGDEAIEFVNGSRILFGAREAGFGRGIPGVDVIFSDEAQILSDRAMNAMIATMNTSQIGLHIYAGTPPAPEELEKAAAWLRARDEAWVIEDKRVIQTYTEDLVWVEIGADDDADLDDVRQWFKNPSVPHRTPIHSVQRLRRKLKDDGFRREGLGIYGRTDGSIFDLDRWNALEADDPGPIDRGALVVDVSPDGRWSSIALATELELDDDPDAAPRTLVIVFSMPGTKGVAAKVADLDAKRDLVDIAMTPGAARALETELTRLGVVYEIMPSNEVAASYVTMQKSIVDGSVAHLAQSELNFAMANSKSRYLQTGETQSFDRREYSVDTSPAVAAACAVYRWGLNNDPMPFIG